MARRFVWALVPAGALALYIYSAYPEPGWIDSGALAAIAHMLDIPHPTGKQLYVLLARLFVVALPGSFFPLTFFSALSLAAGLWLVAQIRFGEKRQQHALLPGVCVALVLAVSPLVWEQGTVNEVHALQIFLFSAFLFFWFRKPSLGRSVMLFYLASLAFANHGTAVFLAPFLIDELWQRRRHWRLVATMLAAALLGLSLYLYFPIRSAAGAFLDWGGTSHWGGFWRHVTGWQYKVWMGGGNWAEFQAALALLGKQIWATFPWLLIPLSLYGLWVTWRRSHRVVYVTGAAFLFCLTFSLNYHIPDIAEYFLLALMIGAVWMGVGVARLWQQQRLWGLIAAAAVVLSLAPGFPADFRELDHRDFHVPTDWVRDAMETVDSGAVVLTDEWDHYSPWYYLRFVKHFRTDVFWIDTELLRRTWYIDFIRKADPERYARAKPALDRLMIQLRIFEAGERYDPATIEGAYANAIYALSLGQPGPVYVDGVAGQPRAWGVERVYFRGAREVPWGLLTRLFRPGETIPPLPSWPDYRNATLPPSHSPRTDFHLRLYGHARAARDAYFNASP